MRLLIGILLLITFNSGAQLTPDQSAKIDSLRKEIKQATNDTTVVRAMLLWTDIIYISDVDLDLTLNMNVDSICHANLKTKISPVETIVFKEVRADALNRMGLNLHYRGEYSKAIDCYNISFEICNEIDDQNGKANVLNNLGIIYQEKGDFEKAREHFKKSSIIHKKGGNKNGLAAAYGNIGFAHFEQGNFTDALNFYQKSIRIAREVGNKKSISTTLNSMGWIYEDQGDFAQAIQMYVKSLKIREEIGDKYGIANTLISLGVINMEQGEFEKAFDFFQRSSKIQEEIGDKDGLAASLNNLGQAYQNLKKYQSAAKTFKRSASISESLGDKKGYSATYTNLGILYLEMGNSQLAMDHLLEALRIRREIGDKGGIANTINNLNKVYLQGKAYKKLIDSSTEALIIAKEVGVLKEIMHAAYHLWIANKGLNNYSSALEMYELYIDSRDSLESEENQKEVIRQEYKYQYEKQAAADSIKTAEADKVKDAQLAAEQAENKQHELEAKQQEEQKMYLFGGLGLALLFGLFIFNRFRVTRKQKGIIEEQKHKVDEAYDELEEKNSEILDSINYAKRIQSAILPPSKLVKEYLNQSFILYKPKDIVAGDFYWMEPSEKGVLFAAADCTGHGVPGAMVSVVCNNGLNRSVREYGLTDPGQILDKTREIVIAEFEKSEEEVKDGMDIALCSLNGNVLEYAGAHNPLWIIRKGATEVEEIKADKQPIGKYAEPKPYTSHTIELDEGDSFYIFSDGYADQFGGQRGKKYKTANFKRLLLSIQNETIEKQKQLIDEAFEAWKGWGAQPLEQLDDVCVIGVRI